MNIGTIILEFYKHRHDYDISGIAADLYCYLLSECDRSNCDGVVSVSTKKIGLTLNITNKTLLKARKELQEAGLIDYKAGDRNACAPQYVVKAVFIRKKETKKETKMETKMEILQEKNNDNKNVNVLINNDLQEIHKEKRNQNGNQNGNQNKLKESTKEKNPPTPPKKENNKEKTTIYACAREKPKVKTFEEIVAETNRRKANFYNSLIPYLPTYGKEQLREFFDYWSETNKSQSKMRFELEKTWEIGRRLARWSNNNKKYQDNGINQQDKGRMQRETEVAEFMRSFRAAHKQSST